MKEHYLLEEIYKKGLGGLQTHLHSSKLEHDNESAPEVERHVCSVGVLNGATSRGQPQNNGSEKSASAESDTILAVGNPKQRPVYITVSRF